MRNVDIGVVPYDMAMEYGYSGVMLRGSGIKVIKQKRANQRFGRNFDIDLTRFPKNHENLLMEEFVWIF